jgi:hypothetical protein
MVLINEKLMYNDFSVNAMHRALMPASFTCLQFSYYAYVTSLLTTVYNYEFVITLISVLDNLLSLASL